MSPNLQAHVERFKQTLKHEVLNEFCVVSNRQMNMKLASVSEPQPFKESFMHKAPVCLQNAPSQERILSSSDASSDFNLLRFPT